MQTDKTPFCVTQMAIKHCSFNDLLHESGELIVTCVVKQEICVFARPNTYFFILFFFIFLHTVCLDLYEKFGQEEKLHKSIVMMTMLMMHVYKFIEIFIERYI